MNIIIRNLSRQNQHKGKISLKGRKYLAPSDLSPEEIKSLLFTATDLDNTCGRNVQVIAAERCITVLLHQPCLRMQTCLHNTAKMLKMSINLLINSDWTSSQKPQDAGKLLSTGSDIIFCQSPRHSKIEMFAEGATVPVINLSSCQFMALDILSDLLTLQQHFGRLDGLTIAWVGKPCPYLNAYLALTPLMGLQIKFFCQCGGPMSPANIHFLHEKDEVYREKLIECKDLMETISGAQVIMTTQHSEKSMTLRRTDLDKHADPNWVFLHNLPRSTVEVEEDIFQSNKNLLWKSFVNTKWICAAIILRFLDVLN